MIDLPEPWATYCRLRGSAGQLVSLIATAAGLKPVLDDWVEPQLVDELGALLEPLGLTVMAEEGFAPLSAAELAEVVGGDLLNTTRARAGDTGLRHVFIGRDPADLREAVASGWYNLVGEDRVVLKPWIDHYWLGQRLGYPECCLRGFAHDGAWNVANPYQAAFARTGTRPHAGCNPAMRHGGLSYVTHYPCRFDCPATLDYATAVRQLVGETSLALLAAADEVNARPYLLVSGWVGFGFEGSVDDRGVTYGRVWPVPTNNPDAGLLALLRRGDRVEVGGDVVRVLSASTVIGTHETRSDRYAPEVPIVVDFAGWPA